MCTLFRSANCLLCRHAVNIKRLTSGRTRVGPTRYSLCCSASLSGSLRQKDSNKKGVESLGCLTSAVQNTVLVPENGNPSRPNLLRLGRRGKGAPVWEGEPVVVGLLSTGSEVRSCDHFLRSLSTEESGPLSIVFVPPVARGFPQTRDCIPTSCHSPLTMQDFRCT